MSAHLVAAFALLLAFFFALAGAQKLATRPAVTSNLARLGVGRGLTRLIGVLELAGAVGVVAAHWCTPLGIGATIGLAALMLGATIFHAQAGDYRRVSRHRDALAPPMLMIALLTFCALLIS